MNYFDTCSIKCWLSNAAPLQVVLSVREKSWLTHDCEKENAKTVLHKVIHNVGRLWNRLY